MKTNTKCCKELLNKLDEIETLAKEVREMTKQMEMSIIDISPLTSGIVNVMCQVERIDGEMR